MKSFNLPNVLTTLRMISVPVFIYLIISPGRNERVLALLVFAFASITDFIDGYLARRWKQETEFGKFLDPLADKALVLGAFITFIFLSPQVQLWMVLLIIARDVLITALRSLAIRRGRSLRTSRLGKWKTAFQMLSIIVIIFSFILVSYRERKSINSLYEASMENGIPAWHVAWDAFSGFLAGSPNPTLYDLATFTPYYLMFFTTIVTVISGLRYLFTNYRLLIPGYDWKSDSEK